MASSHRAVSKPKVASKGSIGAYMLELLTWNGSPFKDHWAYFVRSNTDPDIGVKIHATGDVRNGFEFEIKRSENLQQTDDIPSTRTPLQWIDAEYFDPKAMLNNGKYKIDDVPVCHFERSVYKIKAPGKGLNIVGDEIKLGKKVILRDCQTWILESANQLLCDKILSQEVVDYLHTIKQ
ncbi:hypothetical protein N7457_000613 [Penicillium paradoxum]|uniref:uncharacterized protein n=1 Tax=Penicillium paradoxum TaxID=176176 RepID=UPI0025472711|nr:uncharacterized protein N7457_000613 [Penicillium paradoxum]KAJ5794014.1 hypothetical protein N7457_000613 [Penicillium paradoxum]